MTNVFEDIDKGRLERKPIAKPKKELNVIQVEGHGNYVYKKGFHGEMADISNTATTSEIKKLFGEKNIAKNQVNRLRQERNNIVQKTRKDRLLKKEARVREYQERVKRLAKADKSQMKLQKRLADILNKKRQERLMSQSEIKQQYAQNYSGQNDGNILHAQNLFTSRDNRSKSNRDGGNILHAENLLLRTSKSKATHKWI